MTHKERIVVVMTTEQIIYDSNNLPCDISKVEWVGVEDYRRELNRVRVLTQMLETWVNCSVENCEDCTTNAREVLVDRGEL